MLGNYRVLKNRDPIVWSHVQVAFLSSFATAAGTTFLVGYFRHIGFDEFQIAIFGSIIGIACFFCVFGSWFAQRKGQYKRTVITMFVGAAVFCFMSVFTGAFGGSGKITAVIVLALAALFQLFLFMAIPVFLSWLHERVGQDKWQKFFSTRMMSADAAMVVTVIAVGAYLKDSPGTGRFLLVFTIAAGFCLFSAFCVGRIPAPVIKEKFPEIKTYVKLILGSMRKREIRKLLAIAFIRSFAYGFIMPFQPLFLLEVLRLNYSAISWLICLGAVFAIVFYKVWARIQIRIGEYRSLKWNLLLSVFEPFLWALAVPDNPAPVFLAFALFGFFGAQGMINAGFWPSFLGTVLRLSDERRKPIYTSLYYLVFGAATIFAPLIAGVLLQYLSNSQIWGAANPDVALNSYRVLFIIAGLILIATTIYSMRGAKIERIDLEKKEV